MGAAAYRRGSRAIRESIDRDLALRPATPAVEKAYVAGLATGHEEAAVELRALDGELRRAVRALRLNAATLTEERRRSREALERLEEIRESYRGKGASQGAYVAILCLKRAREALGRVR